MQSCKPHHAGLQAASRLSYIISDIFLKEIFRTQVIYININPLIFSFEIPMVNNLHGV